MGVQCTTVMSQGPSPRFDAHSLAGELLSAHVNGNVVTPPSARFDDFGMDTAYAVEAEFTRLRVDSGRKTTGLKVGYANKAMWRVMKLETLVWAHMYDDTVHYATGEQAQLALPYYRSPKLEPEIVFKLKEPIAAGGLDAAAALQHVDWLAIGFEIIDCPFPGWQFKPADFVAAYGLHAALLIGEPRPVDAASIPLLVEQLASFKLRMSKSGEFVEEGSGKNALRSPALCLAELGGAVLKRGRGPLRAGDLISSGTLTAGHAITKGETWQVEVDGMPLSNLTVSLA
jgi:2-keto-4-pentenoate hydratase